MSSLLDKIKENTRIEAQPMGFRAERKSVRLCPVVIACLASAGIDDLEKRLDGADAVIIPPTAIADIKNIDVIWGAWLDGGSVGEVSKTGGDFVVFKAEETTLDLLEIEDIGKVILADVATEVGVLRAISSIPADAVLAFNGQVGNSSLTWQSLLFYQRLSDFIKQPLLAPVPFSVSEKELQALWGSGVVGLVVELSGQEASDTLKRLRKVVNATDFAAIKKDESSAVVPRVSAEAPKGEASPDTEPEEDDYDDVYK